MFTNFHSILNKCKNLRQSQPWAQHIRICPSVTWKQSRTNFKIVVLVAPRWSIKPSPRNTTCHTIFTKPWPSLTPWSYFCKSISKKSLFNRPYHIFPLRTWESQLINICIGYIGKITAVNCTSLFALYFLTPSIFRTKFPLFYNAMLVALRPVGNRFVPVEWLRICGNALSKQETGNKSHTTAGLTRVCCFNCLCSVICIYLLYPTWEYPI
jgi:hypothetical protein